MERKECVSAHIALSQCRYHWRLAWQERDQIYGCFLARLAAHSLRCSRNSGPARAFSSGVFTDGRTRTIASMAVSKLGNVVPGSLSTPGGTTGHEAWDLAEGLPLMLSDGTNSYVTGADGLPLEQITGSSVTYLYQDQLGSTRALLDGSGTIVGTYTYGPFGDVRSHTGTATTPIGYASQYTDGESELQYLRARYYDPGSEQFLTVDPVAAATGQPYGYASGDPTNAIDPFGLCTVGSISVPIGSANRCSDDVGAAVYNHLPVHRLPDYVNFDLSGAYPVLGIFGPRVGFNATVTRYGQVYVGPELGVGVKGVSGSVRAGWINQGSTPSPCQLDSYVQGPSLTASAFLPLYPDPGTLGVGPSVAETWGNEGGWNLNDFSTEVGVGAGGGHDFGLYQSYSFKLPLPALGW